MLPPRSKRYLQTTLSILLVGVASACTGTARTPICEQAEYDACTACAQDDDCTGASERGEVCAPDMQCWPPSMLRTVSVFWTIGGQPATATTCASLPSELTVYFDDDHLMPDTITVAQVPCTAGMLVQPEVAPDLIDISIVAGSQLLGSNSDGEAGVTIDLMP